MHHLKNYVHDQKIVKVEKGRKKSTVKKSKSKDLPEFSTFLGAPCPNYLTYNDIM